VPKKRKKRHRIYSNTWVGIRSTRKQTDTIRHGYSLEWDWEREIEHEEPRWGRTQCQKLARFVAFFP
jgi:hypothetical protein